MLIQADLTHPYTKFFEEIFAVFKGDSDTRVNHLKNEMRVLRIAFDHDCAFEGKFQRI